RRLRSVREPRGRARWPRSRRRPATAACGDPSRRFFQGCGEDITGVANRLEAVLRKAALHEFLAKPAHLNVDIAIEGVGAAAAGPFDQLIARQNAAGPVEETAQQFELA